MSNSIAGRIVPNTTSVTTTATPIPATATSGRRSILLHNAGSTIVYLGDSTVTTSNGIPLNPAEKISFDLDANVILYGRTGSNSSDVRSLEGV